MLDWMDERASHFRVISYMVLSSLCRGTCLLGFRLFKACWSIYLHDKNR